MSRETSFCSLPSSLRTHRGSGVSRDDADAHGGWSPVDRHRNVGRKGTRLLPQDPLEGPKGCDGPSTRVVEETRPECLLRPLKGLSTTHGPSPTLSFPTRVSPPHRPDRRPTRLWGDLSVCRSRTSLRRPVPVMSVALPLYVLRGQPVRVQFAAAVSTLLCPWVSCRTLQV